MPSHKFVLWLHDSWIHCPLVWRNFIVNLDIPPDVRGQHRIEYINQKLAPYSGHYVKHPDNSKQRPYVEFPSEELMMAWKFTHL